jgi:hypothetical protein
MQLMEFQLQIETFLLVIKKHFKSYMFTLAKVDNHDVEDFAIHLSKI